MQKTYFILIILLTIQLNAQIIPPKREFRGAWVATVANIDWPKNRPNATSGEQISDLITILKKLKESGVNAVLFQVRTECDALYNSKYEPWSYWLTNEQGKAPEPFFDPLEYAIDEAHKLGMELHAWFNPYRAVKQVGDYEVAESHVSVQHPDWILSFGDYKMLDPGLPEVKEYVLNVVKDVLLNYDVDGIHFDDYFYPYSPKVSNEDAGTFEKYGSKFDNIDDWRRNNINSLMSMIYEEIKREKPYVKFGISPFGIVENKYAGTSGLDSYSVLYCDPLNWIKEKSVDYVNPQLYWELEHPRAPYSKLLPWWSSVSNDVHLYIGLFSSQFMGRRFKGDPAEMGNQLRLNRATENVHGVVFFSSSSITNNSGGLFDSLKNDFYRYPALVPLMSWKDNIPPNKPELVDYKVDSTAITIRWNKPALASDNEEVKKYLIYRFNSIEEINLDDPRAIIHITDKQRVRFEHRLTELTQENMIFVITALDRLQNESDGLIIEVNLKR